MVSQEAKISKVEEIKEVVKEYPPDASAQAAYIVKEKKEKWFQTFIKRFLTWKAK